MKKINAEEVISFVKMLHELQSIQRVMHVPGEERYENDLEHSYLLTMSVWYAIDTFKLPLDRNKAIQYALAHDMPEVYAGDTYVFSTDPNVLDTKKTREKNAREKLAQTFPSVPAMHEAMHNYEHQTDPEAVFVRALDKLMPVITNYVQDGRTWKEKGVSFTQLSELKRETTKHCQEVYELTEQLIELLDSDRVKYFGKLTS